MKSVPIPRNIQKEFIVNFDGKTYFIEADVVDEHIQDNRMRFYKNPDDLDLVNWKLNAVVASFPLNLTAIIKMPEDNYQTINNPL